MSEPTPADCAAAARLLALMVNELHEVIIARYGDQSSLRCRCGWWKHVLFGGYLAAVRVMNMHLGTLQTPDVLVVDGSTGRALPRGNHARAVAVATVPPSRLDADPAGP